TCMRRSSSSSASTPAAWKSRGASGWRSTTVSLSVRSWHETDGFSPDDGGQGFNLPPGWKVENLPPVPPRLRLVHRSVPCCRHGAGGTALVLPAALAPGGAGRDGLGAQSRRCLRAGAPEP